ncbi:MAG: glycine cleavage system protein GcvH [Deltaproteobacteria bacterium]|nr:glycine cleavage system protein GcvH [Deltaproteobacteria bacterium]
MEIEGYNLPDDLYYEKNHFWVRVEGDLLVMGMDDFAIKMAGEIVYVQLPEEGKELSAGKKFTKIESGKWLGKVYAPVDGELVESNEALEANATVINEDCYGKGWMFKIRPNNMDDINNLIHDPKDIEAWVLEDIEKYKEEQ